MLENINKRIKEKKIFEDKKYNITEDTLSLVLCSNFFVAQYNILGHNTKSVGK